MAKPLLFAAILLHSVFVLTVLVHCDDQQDFISIDCGALENYTDEFTGINYSTDDYYIDTGVSKNVSPEFNTRNLLKRYSTVRSFPGETKSCYTLRPSKGKNHTYSITAGFMHGNYDGNSQLPEFDLFLGVNKWMTVNVTNPSNSSTFEIIHVLRSDYVHVCLVNTDSGTPFISSIELRLLNDDSYVTQSGSLERLGRWDCGLSTDALVRYRDDTLDRRWWPFKYDGVKVIYTSLPIDTSSTYKEPRVVMSTAITPKSANGSLRISWTVDDDKVSNGMYMNMYFAEIVDLQDNQTREFNIFLNDELWNDDGPVVPTYLETYYIWSSKASKTASENEVRITKTERSTLPPLLNAIEIYLVKQLLFSQTDQKDVDAILNIKSTYGLKRLNWQGDPCAPNQYIWNDLNCSYDVYDPPRIQSLNLSSSGLSGEITPYIFDLKVIQILDLSNNSLSGPVPEFLSRLPLLKVLNLQRNNLSGTLPIELYEKSNGGSILLSLDENSNLCMTSTCENKKKKRKNNNVVVPVLVASIGGFLLLLLTTVAIFWGLKKRKQAGTSNAATYAIDEAHNKEVSVQVEPIKKLQFTYSEVLTITNNFERVIGKGGFGTVYHGYLNGGEVAVKMLSRPSAQGFKEFLAEAKLLTRVYHRNLTSLVGYCVEGPNMGLIYEYLSNRDLARHLSERTLDPLSWQDRLRIAIDAAQGLEYLHNGCKPPIIHRDVKSTNILLNEKLQAKLSDFGLSRAFPAEGDSFVSTVVVGTPGYLDPEYYVSNRLTEKSDVFGFGVVLLEIITGRSANSKKKDQKVGHVIQWVGSILSKGDIDNVIDPRMLKREHWLNKNSVWKAVDVAMACASAASSKRPTMAQVVMDLKQCLAMHQMGTAAAGTNFNSNTITVESSDDHVFINDAELLDPQPR